MEAKILQETRLRKKYLSCSWQRGVFFGTRLHYTITVIITHKRGFSAPALRLKCLDVNINRHQDMTQGMKNPIVIGGILLAN